MFQDEAGFGRINKPKHCWCEKGMREDYADDFHKLLELRSRMLDAEFRK